MEIITTHTNADFDALASMVAARKLYPDAKLVLPGSQERAVRDFMSICEDLVKIDYEKDVSLENIKRLIVVETRSRRRIGKMAQLVDKAGIEIHLYDHHPRSSSDISGSLDVYKKTGATATILAELIRKKDIELTPLEATIMALGIYEDTGSLTFPATTKSDVDMVSFLISKGADLNLVSSYLRRGLTDEELKLLSELINSTEIHIINSIHIAIAAAVSDKYVDDLSLLAFKLEEIENYSAIFIMVQSKDKVQFIARSRLPFIDVSRPAAIFGGGGHHSAAGAIIRDMNLTQVEEKLIGYLRDHIHPDIKARALASSDFIKVSLAKTVREVKRELVRAEMEYAVVFDKAGIAGLVCLKDLDKAVARGFGHSRVKGYMSQKVFAVEPETSIYAIQDIMRENDIGCVPVLEGGALLGLVRRTDILRAFHGRAFEEEEGTSPNSRNFSGLKLASKIKDYFPLKIYRLLRFIGRIADRMDFQVFAVGGFVRDFFLGVENLDIDIVVEGDAIALAKRLSRELKGSFIFHKRFGTAAVLLTPKKALISSKLYAKALKIDLAMTRTEIYERPAALPTVKFGEIENDLFRRDFTINAMAFKLNKRGFGQLLDPFKGKSDLKKKKIRVLHNLSFIDDPTRIFRAVRFEQRFNFKIEPHTEELIKKAAGLRMVDQTQKQRIRQEIVAILNEKQPLKAVKRLSELNELKFLHPGLKHSRLYERLFESVEEVIDWYNAAKLKKRRTLDSWILYFGALVDGLPAREVQKICEDFVFTKGDAIRLMRYKRDGENIVSFLSKKEKLRPSRIYACLEGLPYETMLLFMAKSRSQTVKRRIAAYLTKYISIKLDIKGDDFTMAGIRPGPHFKEIIKKTLYAKLDSKIKTKAEELNFALKREKMRAKRSANTKIDILSGT